MDFLSNNLYYSNVAYSDNPIYAGYIVPPAPPRPDFDASREKLQKLGEAESGQLTKEEFNKMKQELEAEYLATFKVNFYFFFISFNFFYMVFHFISID